MEISLHAKDDRRAKIIAFIFALVLLFLVLYPFWSYTFPPPEKEGILVAFGEVEVVGGDEVKQSQIEENNEVDNGDEEKVKSPVFQESEPAKTKTQVEKTQVETKKAIAEQSDVVAKEVVTPKSPSKEEIERNAEAERAAAEARKKAEYEKAKKQFGDLLGKGTNSGQQAANTGSQEGDPSADALKGLSKGSGKVQGGLSDRGLINEPEIEENSQKAGVVVVKVCVDNSGKVVEASYTQRGSTTTDTDLVNAAIEGAKRYRFSKSPIEKQCGTITIEFKLK